MNTLKFTVNDVVEHMRDGSYLQLMHTHSPREKRWYLRSHEARMSAGRSDGPVKDDVAHTVLAREDVHGCRDGLFPGISQVFKYRRPQ
jgi:hypothetical protein